MTNTEIIMNRMKEAMNNGVYKLDLSDLDVKSKVVYYNACKKLNISPKAFKKIIWSKEVLKREQEYQRKYYKKQKSKKSPTKCVNRQVTEKETELYLKPNQQQHYKFLLKHNDKLRTELKDIQNLYEKALNEKMNQQMRIKELEFERTNLTKKLEEYKRKIKELEDSIDSGITMEEIIERSKFICPKCGKGIENKYRRIIESGHILVSCPHCKSMFAVEPEKVEVTIKFLI